MYKPSHHAKQQAPLNLLKRSLKSSESHPGHSAHKDKLITVGLCLSALGTHGINSARTGWGCQSSSEDGQGLGSDAAKPPEEGKLRGGDGVPAQGQG